MLDPGLEIVSSMNKTTLLGLEGCLLQLWHQSISFGTFRILSNCPFMWYNRVGGAVKVSLVESHFDLISKTAACY